MKGATDFCPCGPSFRGIVAFRRPSPRHDLRHRRHENHLRPVGIRRRQQHALALDAAHRPRLEVCHDDDLLADELLRLVVAADAGNELPLFRAEVDLEDEQPIGVRMRCGLENARDAEVELGEVVNVICAAAGSDMVVTFPFFRANLTRMPRFDRLPPVEAGNIRRLSAVEL